MVTAMVTVIADWTVGAAAPISAVRNACSVAGEPALAARAAWALLRMTGFMNGKLAVISTLCEMTVNLAPAGVELKPAAAARADSSAVCTEGV